MAFKGQKKVLESADGTSFPISLYDFEFKCFYSIFTKKRNSHGHFKYIKNIKLYLGVVVSVLSRCVHPTISFE